MRVDTWKELEKTQRVHVHVRLLSQDSAFDLFSFLSKSFFQNLSCQTRGAAYLPVRLICRCLRYIASKSGFFEEILCNGWVQHDFVIRAFCLPQRKYNRAVFFFLIFPAKMSRSNVITAHFSLSKCYFRSF